MGWTSPANHVYTVGELVTPATLNTYVKDNLIDLHRRTSPVEGHVGLVEGRTGVDWADLATIGPQVSIEVGQTGKAMVSISASMSATVGGAHVRAGYALSGANTKAPNEAGRILAFNVPFADNFFVTGASFLETGLLPGVTTFTMKYAVTAGTGKWDNRRIAVQALGS